MDTRDPRTIISQRLDEGKLLVVVGTGISLAATQGHPHASVASWPGLLQAAVQFLADPKQLCLDTKRAVALQQQLSTGSRDDLLDVASAIEGYLTDHHNKLLKVFLQNTIGKLEPLQPHILNLICSLGAPIITTNYDCLIEQASGLRALTWHDQRNVAQMLKGEIGAVLHLHGHYNDPETIVLGAQSYESIVKDSFIQNHLREMVVHRTLLFVGCGDDGIRDPNLGALFEWIRKNATLVQHEHFLIARNREVLKLKAQHTLSERVEFVSYGEEYSQLDGYLQEILLAKKCDTPKDLVTAREEIIVNLSAIRDQGNVAGQSKAQLNERIRSVKRQRRNQSFPDVGDDLSGRYRLLEKIGQGGFAKVFRAIDLRNQQTVAVKILRSRRGDDQNQGERFNRGARKMKSLDHANIVKVLELPGDSGTYNYFVMEYLSGGNLAEAIKANKLERQVALRLLLDIGAALEFAHQQGIIHRDVKPQNIILDDGGRVKLTDFDLVWAADSTGGTRTEGLGTVCYAAPEQLQNGNVADARSDIYSLAVTALFVILGKPPLSHPMSGGLGTTLHCSGRLRRVLECAMAPEPSQRYQTMVEFRDSLKNALDDKPRGILKMAMMLIAGLCFLVTTISIAEVVILPNLANARKLKQANQLLASITHNIETRNWYNAKSAAEQILLLGPLPAELSKKFSLSSQVIERELRAQILYEQFTTRVAKGEYDQAITIFSALSDDSLYRAEAETTYRLAVGKATEKHLASARNALIQNNCSAFEREMLAISSLSPGHPELAALKQKSCATTVAQSKGKEGSIMATARSLFAQAKFTKAMRAADIAMEQVGVSHTEQQEAMSILGKASCAQKDRDQATRAWRKLTEEGRRELLAYCAVHGVSEIPDYRAEELASGLSLARSAYLERNYKEAVKLALPSVTASPDTAWRLIGAAACGANDIALANQAHSHLDSLGKSYVRLACQRLGVVLPNLAHDSGRSKNL